MTGFGRGEETQGNFRAEVEISSVNRKQAEIVFSIPRNLSALESSLRKQALTSISRGRLTISLKVTALDPSQIDIGIDLDKAKALHLAFEKLSAELNHPLPLTAQDFLRQPDQFFTETTLPLEEVRPVVEKALAQALDALVTMRTTEGQALFDDSSSRLSLLEQLAADIALLAPEVPKRQKTLLLQRLKESGLEINDSDERLLKELALFSERCDISEEITRLTAHFQRFREMLASEESVGRSLDFLCQEINREFNTIGSKANDSKIAHHVVAGKTELEKIREQVQNIE